LPDVIRGRSFVSQLYDNEYTGCTSHISCCVQLVFLGCPPGRGVLLIGGESPGSIQHIKVFLDNPHHGPHVSLSATPTVLAPSLILVRNYLGLALVSINLNPVFHR